MFVNVNSKALRDYTKRLKSLSKSAFPVVAKQTLNGLAFDVKKNTMPASAKKRFVQRQENFFKANSKVVVADGWNVNKMQSVVGFFSNNLRGGNNRAVEDLEQQEYGGSIPKKDFIAESDARDGKGLIKPSVRLGRMPRTSDVIVPRRDSKSRSGRTILVSQKQAFIRAAIVAKTKGKGYVFGNKLPGGGRTISKINRITGLRKSIVITRTPLYNFKRGRTTAVKATQFMKRASYETSMKADSMYIRYAQLQFKKHLSK